MTQKTCSGCKVLKNFDQFYKSSRNKSGIQTYCKDCHTKHRRTWRATNKEKVIPRTYLQNKEAWLKKKYKITISEWDQLFVQQSGKCLGCGRHQSDLSKALCVDHCHSTGQIRGLLCLPCNQALGLVKDNTQILENLKIYLNRSNLKLVSNED